jgi:hypothetical protein
MDMSKPAPKPSPSVAAAKKQVATTKATKKAPVNQTMKRVTDKYGKDYYKVEPGSAKWKQMANDTKTFGD